MTTAYKILGQAAPANTSNADVYTVPSTTEAVVSTILVANVTTGQQTCRIFVRKNGATAGVGNAIIYDGKVPANDFIAITIGITLSAADVITVQSSAGNALTFHAFGSEIA
jgi:hypothetical protein